MKIYLIIGIYCLSSFSRLIAEQLQAEISTLAAILINADTGAILFEKEAHTLHYPASTTKIATALYTLKTGADLDQQIVAEGDALAVEKQVNKLRANHPTPAYWLESDGTHIGIKRGEKMVLRDLLEGMLIASGNDAANVIAYALGPGVPHFMEKLNAYLKQIGCRQTHFCNPHGLHHPDHRTTAYELALITREALHFPLFCQWVSQTRFVRPKTNLQGAQTFLQTNRLLRSGQFFYPKAIGVKTGYHAKAKKTFVGAARLGERTLIVVLLGCPERNKIFAEAIQLFEMAFNQPKINHIYLPAGEQVFTYPLPELQRSLQVLLRQSISCEYYPAEDPKNTCRVQWYPLTLPIQIDQEVGEVQLIAADGKILSQHPLYAAENIKVSSWKNSRLLLISIGIGAFLLISFGLLRAVKSSKNGF